EQGRAVCETLKDHLHSIIKTAMDFAIILKHLTLEQGRAVYETLKNHLHSIIKTAMDFAIILETIPSEQRTVVYKAYQNHLPSLIQTAWDFSIILWKLSPEQCRVFCEAYHEHLPSFIKTARDFLSILLKLSPERCRAVCEACKDHLPQLIQKNIDIEILNTRCHPDNVSLLKHYYLLASLDAYITRVEGHSENDFSYSFWHQKTSRDLNQEVDYKIAKKIKETMITQSPYEGDIDTLLSPKNLKDMRDEIVTNLKTSRPFFNENYVERGMNSDALTKTFRLVRTPEFRQLSLGNGRR
ncbi:MAG: hypothetical protein HY939_04745, partial [Gammaproteobacteria bacterium]|nr:hypothetical protein [Gammaproteobacteria bacterium]